MKELNYKKFLEGDWSTKYHYTNDSLSLDTLIEKINNNDLEDLYNKIKELYEKNSKDSSNRVDTFFEYLFTEIRVDGKDPFVRFKNFLEKRFLPLDGMSKINASRLFCKDDLKDIDWDDVGICWTFSFQGLDEVKEWMDGGTYEILLHSEIDVNNIDWLETVLLNFIFPREYEVRIKDVKKITLKGYEIRDYDSEEEIKSVGKYVRLLDYDE